MGIRSFSRIGSGLLLAALGTSHAQPLSNVPRQDFWVTDGAVNAIAVTNDRVFIGGDFRYVGPYTGGGVPVDVNTMQPVAKYPKVNGSVHAVEPDGQGGWFIGGLFTTVGGRPRTNLAHITAEGEVNTNWVAHATGGPELGRVNKLALDGDTLYAVGEFTHLGGQPRLYVGALLSASGTVKSWAPQMDGAVLSVAVSPKAVYLGGEFRYVGSSNRNYVAGIDKTTAEATAWDPNADVFPFGYVTNGFITALATYSNLVFAAGPFRNFFDRHYLVALDDATGFRTWGAGKCFQLYDLRVNRGTLYAVGAFGQIGGDGENGHVSRDRVAALDAVTGQVLPWHPIIGGTFWVNTITFSGNVAYVGGAFNSLNPRASEAPPTNAHHIVTFDLTTGVETGPRRPFNNGFINALAAQGGEIYFGGGFDSLAGVPHQHLAELDRRDGSLKPWNPNVNGRITALSLANDRLVVGGNFSVIDGQSRSLLAALGLPELDVLPWAPVVATEEFGTLAINAMVPDNDRLLLAGEFQQAAGQARRNLAFVSLETGEALPWHADTDGAVDTAIVAGGRVYVGGRFNMLGGQVRPHLGAVDLVTAEVSAWNPAPDNWVTSMSANSSAVYSAGYFMNVSGDVRTGYAAHDLASGTLLPWNLEALSPGLFGSTLLCRGGEIVVSGAFSGLGGTLNSTVLRVNQVTGAPAEWNPLPHVFSPRSGLMAAGETLFLIGNQNLYSGITRKWLAVFEPPGFSRFVELTPQATTARLRLSADQAVEFVVERTPDFNNWTSISTNIAWEGTFEVTDLTLPSSQSVFYRAKTSQP